MMEARLKGKDGESSPACPAPASLLGRGPIQVAGDTSGARWLTLS